LKPVNASMARLRLVPTKRQAPVEHLARPQHEVRAAAMRAIWSSRSRRSGASNSQLTINARRRSTTRARRAFADVSSDAVAP
jgi:hypothetical protein